MTKSTRRTFLATLAAVAVAPFVPMPSPAVPAAPAPLQFHPDAFALTMSPLANRMDVLYGVGTIRPNLAARVER